MKILRPVKGRILSRTEGLGTPSAYMVRQRAEELATIDSRESPREQDWKLAFMELHGGCQDAVPREEESVGEELIGEGLEEAIHDQMLQSRREEARREEG